MPEGVDLEPALNQILARILREVVLPVAGSSMETVQRVADGCATSWVNDNPEDVGRAADAFADAAANTGLATAQVVLDEVGKA